MEAVYIDEIEKKLKELNFKWTMAYDRKEKNTIHHQMMMYERILMKLKKEIKDAKENEAACVS
jgi:hypothetical protein